MVSHKADDYVIEQKIYIGQCMDYLTLPMKF